MQIFLKQFVGEFGPLKAFFQSPKINLSVQRPNTFLEANNMAFYAILLHLAKCREFTHKSAPRLPKIEGGEGFSQFWAIPVLTLLFNRPGVARAIIQSPPSLIN